MATLIDHTQTLTRVSREVGGRTLTMETGVVARQAGAEPGPSAHKLS